MHYKKYAQLPHEEKWNGFRLDYKYIEGFSPLFYETGGTHWDLDHDADNFLYDVIFRYWLDSEDSPEEETLYLKALRAKKTQLDEDRERFFKNSVFYQSAERRDLIRDLTRGNRDKHPDEVTFSRMYQQQEEISSKIYRFIPEYLRAAISSDMVYLGDIYQQQDHENTPYNWKIIRYPGKYLYHYFHDQLVFDNYVQSITVPQLDEKAIRLLDSGVLLEPKEDDPYGWHLDRVMAVVENNYRGWWT